MDFTLDAPPKISTKVQIRAMRGSDFNFVINSWLKTYKYSNQTIRRVTDSVYFSHYEPIVKSLIHRSDVYIAALREDPDVIVGWLAIERQPDKDLIHFCLVKDLWQRMGVMTYLLMAAAPKLKTQFTHWTQPCDSLINKFPFPFNPFVLYKEPQHGRFND